MSAVVPFIVYAMPEPDLDPDLRPLNPTRDARMKEAFDRGASVGEKAAIAEGATYLGRLLARDDVDAVEKAAQCWPKVPAARLWVEAAHA